VATSVSMSIDSADVQNEQTAPTFDITQDGSVVGTLTVSKGGLRWRTRHAHQPVLRSWTAFDELIKTHGPQS
jgi:hypothetical protein